MGVGIAAVLLVTTAGVSISESADAATPVGSTAGGRSPATAADAPHTKTVNWLVDHMTPSEELNLIEGSWANKTNVDVTLDPDSHNQAGYVRGIKRLGIPQLRHADALGIELFSSSTSYPTRLGLASSFDRSLFNEFGERVGLDGKQDDVDLVYGPQVDLARTPSWRRNMTAFSEDPYLASQLGAEEINGIQSTGLLSQVKHVSFYNGQDQNTPSIVNQQAAHEIYLAPAEAAAQAGVSSMMCSYASFQIQGQESKPDYACSNSGLLNDIVKGQWGFTGWITTDYGGGKAPSDLLAGTDQEFLSTNFSSANLLPLLDPTSDQYNGAYAAAAQNSVSRILYQYERFGLLDNDYIPAQEQSSVAQHGDVNDTDNSITIDKAAGIRESLKLAEESAVLLKNHASTLPLAKGQTVAVMGQSARLLPAGPGGERAIGFGDRANITPLKAMKAIAGDSVTSAPGVDLLGDAVPASAFTTDADGTQAGLTRTAVDAAGTSTSTTDTALDGRQTNLEKGTNYTWSGYVNVPAGDNYRLLIQRPYGTDLGNDAKFNQDTRPASNSTVSLTVDGAKQTLADPDNKVLPNAYPTYAAGTAVKTTADNGQYLGYQNAASNLTLTPGRHQVSITYNPSAVAATTPTLRFAWSAKNAAVQKAVDAAAINDVSMIYVDDANPVTGDGESPLTDVAQLSADQNDLVNKVTAAAHAAGHKVVVVVNSGGAVQMPWADDVDSILEMWYPGQEGGTATANTVYGKSDPSGKLTLTFPKNSKQTLFAGHPERSVGTKDAGETVPSIKWTEGLDIGYRWYDSAQNTNDYKPLYAFGHGLSYTKFDYSGLKVKNAADGGLDLSFTVKNSGKSDGAEAPQVYVGPSKELPSTIQQAPVKLVQFDKVQLAAGKSQNVALHVTARDLSSWSDASQNWVLGTGTRSVLVGAASDDIRLTAAKDVPLKVVAPKVTKNPVKTVKTTAGKKVTLTAIATGSPRPSIAWQRSTDKGKTWQPIAGATSGSYAFTASRTGNGAQYRAEFTNELGVADSTATTVTVAKATASVKAKLAKSTVSTRAHATAQITVAAPDRLSPAGTVTVKVTSKGHVVATKTAKVSAGKATATLPLIGKAGRYDVVATFAGNTNLNTAKSATIHLQIKR